jgi:hypothetical protein
MENSRAINKLHDIVERTFNDVRMLIKHFQMVQTQIDWLTKVQKDLLVNASREKHAYKISTRNGASTQDPLYPEGHPKRIEQDSQQAKDNSTHAKKKKKKHKIVVESSDLLKILIVYLSLMVKLKVVMIKMMLLINKNLVRNLKSILRIQSTLRKISLLMNMVVRENLGCKNQCLFLIRNTNQRKNNTITSSVNG